MAWPNPFRRRDENTRTCWGYTFQLTPEHLTAEQSHPLKFSYDTLAEECLDLLNEIVPPQPVTARSSADETNQVLSQEVKDNTPAVKAKRDLYLLLKDHADKDAKLRQLWDEANTVPNWVDWDQIARGIRNPFLFPLLPRALWLLDHKSFRDHLPNVCYVGQEVFYRYGGATLTGLAYQSLLGGMGANRVVEVLARTGGFSVKVARHRLFETTQHILECTKSLESIKPGGAGFASSIRVRLLHAAVRKRIMKLEKSRPGYYNVEKYGVPINDLDCIATIGTFSGTIIWLSLPRQGIWLRQQEIDDYIALWRLIAYYTGTPTEPFETPGKAKAIMESLLMNEINPTETSKVLAANIIRCLEAQPPAYASRSFLEVNARWLNGNDLCDALALGRPSLYYWTLMAGQCIFFMSICYFYRSIPWLDQRKIKALRHIFWTVIVEGKYGLGEQTVFDFKYIPDYHVTTDRGSDEQTGIRGPGVERRNLTAFITALACTGVVTYCSVRAAAGILQRLF